MSKASQRKKSKNQNKKTTSENQAPKPKDLNQQNLPNKPLPTRGATSKPPVGFKPTMVQKSGRKR